MPSKIGTAGLMFRTLGDAGINIIMIATSEIRISCVISEDFADNAVKIVHEKFAHKAVQAG